MAQSTRVKERQAAQALRVKQAQAFMVPDSIDVAILGGGAAGLCAAITTAEALGANKCVVIFEKALESGRTILATGGGRCNFTNADLSFENFSHPEFVQAVCKDKDTFLADILAFFRSSGLAWATEDEGRMYPLTRQASSIQSLLLKRAQKAGVQFALGREVTSVKPQRNNFIVAFKECFAGEKTYKVHASSVVLATGGLTTTKLAESLQLQTTSLRPGLCALTCTPQPPTSLDGKRVRAHATLVRNGAVLKEESGELLFRSFGLSGIMIFNLSRTALPGDVLEIDLLPQLREEEVAAAVEAHTTDGLLDPQIAAYLGVSDSVEITVAKAHKIAFTVTGTSAKVVPQVCVGGISVEQVDSITLEAHDIPGLFIAGEALDIDAQCGGFNLSWAWKSGMVAGLAAAKSANQNCESLKEDN
jgi:HI0933 family protein